jgi:tetratricopeptide (TPR) repeat protein
MMSLTGRQRALALGILLAVTASAYRGVILNGFVYDDRVTVAMNPAVRSLTRASEWFVSPHAASANRGGKNYRPIVVATYAVDHALWAGRAAGFHATNLAIHLAVVVLVFAAARRLWRADVPALVGAGWMALHPVNAQAVNYISARSSTLAAAFLLAAVILYDRWVEARAVPAPGRGPTVWLAGALGCGLLALGTKESVAVLPLLILAWDRARFGATATWRASATRSLPFWGLLAGGLALRAMVVGQGTVQGDMPLAWVIQGLAFGAKIVNTAVGHSLWPVGLAVDYAWPPVLGLEAGLAAIAGTAALVLAGWGLVRVDRRMAWCAAWFGVALLPVLALPFVTRIALYHEHRVYLAEVGVAWLVGGAVWWAASRASAGRWIRGAGVAAATVLVIVMAWTDGRHTWAWGDTVRLWEDVLRKYPESGVARGERGTWLLNNGRLNEAEQEFLAVLKTMPDYVYPYLMLGVTYANRGEPERAVAAYRTALELRPTFVEARIRLGLAYEDLGLADQALIEYDRAIQDDPWASPALVFSALIMERQGRTVEARQRLRRVAPDDPIYPDARVALQRLGFAPASTNGMVLSEEAR